jgi:hypothetical protein
MPLTEAPLSPTATDASPTETPVPALPVAQDDARIRPAGGMTMLNVSGGAFSMESTDSEIQDALARCRQSYGYCNLDFYGREAPQHAVGHDTLFPVFFVPHAALGPQGRAVQGCCASLFGPGPNQPHQVVAQSTEQARQTVR